MRDGFLQKSSVSSDLYSNANQDVIPQRCISTGDIEHHLNSYINCDANVDASHNTDIENKSNTNLKDSQPLSHPSDVIDIMIST